MDNKLEGIIQELKTFFDAELCREYFTIIYGSYAYGANILNSDLDFVAVSRDFNQNNLRNTLDFVFDLYKRYNLSFDDEVPHEKKLLANYKTLDEAIDGRGFERRGGGRIYVPLIVKTREFLNSDEIAMRLLLNAITSKNIFVSGDHSYYSQKRKQAVENIVGLMFSIDDVDSFTVNGFVQSLIGSSDRHGEMYLGYKDKPAVRTHLIETFGKEFKMLVNNGILRYESDNDRYHLVNVSWLGKIVG
ncbi:MAG: hypothetical protein ABIC91_03585 [Nanoarchaeota archaeon]|nr:hypothetical protein [Nanoarchaeota archaeon]MBU1029630.1 hypothetical protein [Nanoarchaeota archaeon]MBU1850081.1 hypothetical protein [Nanoarchaeota archaeon]